MGFISVHISRFVHTLFAIVNFIACSIFGIFAAIQIYQQREQRNKVSKLSAIGLSCILVATLSCLVLLNTQTDWYFGDERYCDLSTKLAAGTYNLYRAFLYMFIVLRMEVVNQANFIKPRIIDAGKVVIGGMGTFMVVATIVLSKGVSDQYHICDYEINWTAAVIMFVCDVLICVGGTWMFTRPIMQSLQSLECDRLSLMLNKTKFWSIICLLSTLISMLAVIVVDGAAGVVGFDCSITSFSLLMIMKPVRPKVASQSSSNIEKKPRVDVGVELINVGQENPSSGLQTSDPSGLPAIPESVNRQGTTFLNREIDSVLNQDTLTEIE